MSVTLVLGGARSGKSRFAESLATNPKHYIATAQALDDDMAQRILLHQQRRGEAWTSHDVPFDLVRKLQELDAPQNFILVDCLTLWLSNLLLNEADCAELVHELVMHLQSAQAEVVIVSNEVGLGIVPDNALGRAFRDLQGLANQSVAAVASSVVFIAAGLPLTLKGPLPTAPTSQAK